MKCFQTRTVCGWLTLMLALVCAPAMAQSRADVPLVAQFTDTPQTYEQKTGVDLPVEVSGFQRHDRIVIQAWHHDRREMIRDFTEIFDDAPVQIKAQTLDAVVPGRIQVQALTIRDGRLTGRVVHDMTVVEPAPKPVLLSATFGAIPAEYQLESGLSLPLSVSGFSSGDAVVILAWDHARRQLVDAFSHDIRSGPFIIAAEKMNLLPEGRIELQVLSLRKGQRRGSVQKADITIVPKPNLEVALPGVPTQYQQGSGLNLPIAVDHFQPGDTLVIQAWHHDLRTIPAAFTHTITSAPFVITAAKLNTLPEGKVQLQVICQRNGVKLADPHTAETTILAPIPEPVVVPEPELAEALASFTRAVPQQYQQGSGLDLPFKVENFQPGDKVVVQAWHKELRRIPSEFTHTLTKAPFWVMSGKLNFLPAGSVELQLLTIRDGQLMNTTRVSTEMVSYVKPAPAPAPAPSPVDDVSSDTSADSGNDSPVETPSAPSDDSSTVDSSQDASSDSGTDAPNDNASDSGSDSSSDTATDTSNDSSTDNTSDLYTDVSSGSAAGFFVPAKSSDTRVIYVSSSSGNDDNNGLSPSSAVASPSKGYQLLRNGRPDHLLFKAGDTFRGGLPRWTRSGRSADEPMVVGVYGSGARPKFYTDGQGLIHNHLSKTQDDAGVRHVRFTGLHAYANLRDPDSPEFNGGRDQEAGIRWLRNSDDILFEDFKVEFFKDGFIVQGNRFAGDPDVIRNFTLRRNIIVNQYFFSGRGHSQGIYGERVHNLVIEQNHFDHNGHHPRISGAYRTLFNHNIYLQYEHGAATLRGNIIARGASHGAQVRPGGQVLDNLFMANAIAVTVQTRDSVANGNVVLYGDDIDPNNRQLWRGWGIELAGFNRGTLNRNIVAHRVAPNQWWPGVSTKVDNLSANDNIVYKWLRSNDGEGIEVRNQLEGRNNHETNDARRFVDPDRHIRDYARQLGVGDDMNDVLQAGANRPRGVWNEALTAKGINAWFREGFQVVPFD